eukprot:5896130-Amphidinium_carterae.2
MVLGVGPAIGYHCRFCSGNAGPYARAYGHANAVCTKTDANHEDRLLFTVLYENNTSQQRTAKSSTAEWKGSETAVGSTVYQHSADRGTETDLTKHIQCPQKEEGDNSVLSESAPYCGKNTSFKLWVTFGPISPQNASAPKIRIQNMSRTKLQAKRVASIGAK